MYNLFGTDAKNPPYSVVEGMPYTVSFNMENWEKYLSGDGCDKYFDYFKCSRGDSTWYERLTKPEWLDKITWDIFHLPIEKLEETLTHN